MWIRLSEFTSIFGPQNVTSQAEFCSTDATHLVTLQNTEFFGAEITSFG
jgi:hypothetical protein